MSDILERIKREIDNERRELQNAEGLERLRDTLKNYEGEYRLIWSDELLQRAQEKPQSPLHATGILSLDAVIGGFREQQLISLFAHTKHGKTQMGLFLLEQLHTLNPVMIPLEQSAEEIVEQRHSNGYSIPRFLSPERLAAQVTVDWIEERVVEGIAKHNTKLVLIDHLGYINDMGKDGEFRRENQAYRIEKVMKGLKNLAKRWNVVVILLVHISQSDESKPPSLSDIKGSSSVAQESDLVMSIWRKNEMRNKVRIYSNLAMLAIQANRRNGRNGSIGLEFDTQTGRYRENGGWVAAMMQVAEQEALADEFEI
jgi:replicative DNA helicase